LLARGTKACGLLPLTGEVNAGAGALWVDNCEGEV
jgi:hypothetical protein